MSKHKVTKVATISKGLIVLAADKDTKEAVDGLLCRHPALKIRPITFQSITHPFRDPGCITDSKSYLNVYLKSHHYAMVVFDREGSGKEDKSRSELEAEVERSLRNAGWEDRTAAIVIDPELENWVWSPSPHVIRHLGWTESIVPLRDWLVEQKWLTDKAQIKPTRPKEAMESALKKVCKPRSAAIYRSLAESVSLERCTDPAFVKFCDTLQNWFPKQGL